MWDDGEVNVTSNLENSLRHIRGRGISRGLWVDALCINQSDVAEKSVQVQLMSQIHRNAKVELCWLGEESADSDVTLEAFENVGAKDFQLDVERFKDAWKRMGEA